jgi:V8-like Glu-specific endopeptidase
MNNQTAILMALIFSAGCRPEQGAPEVRTPSNQQNNTVRVETNCMFPQFGGVESGIEDIDKIGNGVIISNYQVVTAKHVIDCIGMDATVHIILPNGKSQKAIWQEDIGTDLVKIQIMNAGTLGDFKPPILKPFGAVGDTACITSLGRGTRCGEILPYHSVEVSSYHGDSGSGVYDSSGHLTGILVKSRNFEPHLAIVEPLTHL